MSNMQHVSFKSVPQASKFQIVARKKSVLRQKSARQLSEYDLQTFFVCNEIEFFQHAPRVAPFRN